MKLQVTYPLSGLRKKTSSISELLIADRTVKCLGYMDINVPTLTINDILDVCNVVLNVVECTRWPVRGSTVTRQVNCHHM